MKPNDYVKYITQQLVSYMDKPKDIRKEDRLNRKSEPDLYVNRWFGIIPFALMLLFKRKHIKQ